VSDRRGDRNPNWADGRYLHPLYQTWKSMIRRCYNSRHTAFRRYGGRGITVCDRWRNDFWAFAADMGERPSNRSLDRIDNDGNYEPGNCRWATRSEQRLNARLPRRDVHTGQFMAGVV
jgi:hypothetical protein